jgi:hypothetical protein
VKCRHLIFWLESQRGVYCHTAKLEPNWRVTIDRVPLLVDPEISFVVVPQTGSNVLYARQYPCVWQVGGRQLVDPAGGLVALFCCRKTSHELRFVVYRHGLKPLMWQTHSLQFEVQFYDVFHAGTCCKKRDQELIFMYNFVLFFCLSLIYGNELLASTSRNNRVILLFVYAWTLRKFCTKESGMWYLEVPTFVVWHHAGNKEHYVIVMWVGTVSLKNFSCWWAHCQLPDDAWVHTLLIRKPK